MPSDALADKPSRQAGRHLFKVELAELDERVESFCRTAEVKDEQ